MNEKITDSLGIIEKEPTTEKVLAIDIEKIKQNPFQPRKVIEDDKIEELAQSIKASGLIQPVVVRRAGDGYQLVVGERRLLACKRLGWQKISAAVKVMSDNDMAAIALIENLQRENLNYIEEAMGYLKLMQSFKLTQEALAKKLGKSQSTIANKIRILKLDESVRKMLLENGLTERHARALLKVDSAAEQKAMIAEIVKSNLNVSEAEKIITRDSEKKNTGKRKKKKPIVRDMRIVLNTIRETIKMLKKSGIQPEVTERVEDDYLEVKIVLTRNMVKKQK